MQQSVLLCISTILDSGNRALCLEQLTLTTAACSCTTCVTDYSKMMEMVDDYGNAIFESIKITLVRTPLGLCPCAHCSHY